MRGAEIPAASPCGDGRREAAELRPRLGLRGGRAEGALGPSFPARKSVSTAPLDTEYNVIQDTTEHHRNTKHVRRYNTYVEGRRHGQTEDKAARSPGTLGPADLSLPMSPFSFTSNWMAASLAAACAPREPSARLFSSFLLGTLLFRNGS